LAAIKADVSALDTVGARSRTTLDFASASALFDDGDDPQAHRTTRQASNGVFMAGVLCQADDGGSGLPMEQAPYHR
jgi:hypothetical protein